MVFVFADDSYLSPLLLSNFNPTRAQNSYHQPTQSSAAVWLQYTSPEPESWPLPTTTYTFGGGSPMSCVLACCLSDSCHQPQLPCIHPWQDLIATKVYINSQSSQAACGLKFSLSCHGPIPWDVPATPQQMLTAHPYSSSYHNILLLCKYPERYHAAIGLHTNSQGSHSYL